MSLNSTSSNSSVHEWCLTATRNLFIFTAIFIIHILLIPLFIFVLYVGYQQRQKRRSVSTAVTMSHSDVLMFNMVALELISILGVWVYSLGIYTNQVHLIIVGFSILAIVLPGQILFHLLACMERYLAVVHPITYMGLRQAAVIRIRNVTIGCVWMICFVSVGLKMLCEDSFGVIYDIIFIVIFAVVVSSCSVSIVCVLIRPGPGKRERVDPMKQKAFYSFVILTGALLLKFLSNMVCASIILSSEALGIDGCFVWSFTVWFGLPGCLVIPLLFLHRAGKLPCGFCQSSINNI